VTSPQTLLSIGAGRPCDNAQPGSRQQESEDLAVQRASVHFLQQVEDSRRRYAFEVEELKVMQGAFICVRSCNLVPPVCWDN